MCHLNTHSCPGLVHGQDPDWWREGVPPAVPGPAGEIQLKVIQNLLNNRYKQKVNTGYPVGRFIRFFYIRYPAG